MPVYIGGEVDAVGVKWVSGYPGNPARGLPYIKGLIILNDPSTGIPIAVMDATWITMVRTGAASGVAAKYLAPVKTKSIGIIGLGVQGRIHLLALREVLEFKKAYVYDIVVEKIEGYIEEMESKCPGVELVPCRDYKCATRDADVVVTATTMSEEPRRFIGLDDLKKDFLVIAVDYDVAVKEEVVNTADVFVVDDKQQYLATRAKGPYFKNYPDKVELDMGDICAKRIEHLRNKPKKAAVLLGIAVHDVIVAKLVYEKAVKQGTGTTLPL